MIKISCRLWNLSLFSVIILTLCNILLTFRLLSTDGCPPQHLPSEFIPAPLQHHLSVPTDHPSPPCHLLSTVEDGVVPYKVYNSSTFDVDLRLGRWDAKRMFKMFDAAVVGDRYAELSEKSSVCLATQSSLEKLHSLVQVAHHWTGPISAAVYAAGDEYHLLKIYVEYLRRCFPVVKERVMFHLAIPIERRPPASEAIKLDFKMDCAKPELTLINLMKLRSSETAKWRVKLPYPQNHMRNLARKNCQSGFVFLTDVDIIPSARLAEGLEVFLKGAKCKLCAYVIPTFEIDERVRFPPNKTDLLRLAKKGLARPFHHKVFIYNQYATNFTRWQDSPDDKKDGVHVSHTVTNFEFLYEPFYVASDAVPPHDERFMGYGYTRNTQVYEMFVAGYQFQVLSPIFTCHWGLQNKKGRPSWRERQNSMNRRNFEVFKNEVFARYRKDPLKMLEKKKPAAAGAPNAAAAG